ncbi:MAG TPA: PA14 domain-containing protein [Candidatus Saccharimonadales bacterium]|jgi:RHS repeat-associated protein
MRGFGQKFKAIAKAPLKLTALFLLHKKYKLNERKIKDFNMRFSAVTVATVFTFSSLTVGLGSFLYDYQQKQARTPQALNNVASGAVPVDLGDAKKVSKLPDKMKNELSETRKVLQNGKPRDLTKVKVLDEDRSPTQKTFLNKDGSKTVEQSVLPTSYQKDGKWQDIDMTLEKDKSKNEWKTKANKWQVTFKKLTETEGVNVKQGNQTAKLTPIGGKDSEPEVSDSGSDQIVTYKNVWPGVDVKYEVNASELKESIVISKPESQTNFKFKLDGASLSPNPDQPGYYKLDGEMADLNIAPPTVGLADQGIVGSEPYVKQTISNNEITVDVDKDWFSKLDKKSFPVIVDPSFVSNNGFNYVNYRHDGYVCNPGMGCSNSAGNNRPYYIWRFATHANFDQLQDPNKYLLNASLHLQMVEPNDSSISTKGTYDGRMFYARHLGAFNYHGIDGSYGTASANIGYQGDMDVTELYRKAIAGGDFGFWMMVNGDESDNYTFKTFDYEDTRVTFTYDNLPAASALTAPADKATVVNVQPFLTSGYATDPDGQAVKYRFRVTTGNDGNSGMVVSSDWLDSPQWTVPDNALKDGTTYYWKVQTWDQVDAGNPATGRLGSWKDSEVRSFRVDMRNGKDATQAFDTVEGVSTDLATGNVTTSNNTHSVSALGGSLGLGLEYNSPVRSRNGLTAQYWNDAANCACFPSTAPAVTRVDGAVDSDWLGGSPQPGTISNDHFLARWQGYFVAPLDGTYKFGADADDGVRIFVNNETTAKLDSWGYSSPTLRFGTDSVQLTAGQIIPIKIEYFDWEQGARMKLYVKGPQFANAQSNPNGERVVLSNWLQTGVKQVSDKYGLTGRYYYSDNNGPSPSFPANANDRLFLTRNDSQVSFHWGGGSPIPGAPSDDFMVRWSGYITPQVTDNYKFKTVADDGSRVFLNNSTTPILNNWADNPGITTQSNTVQLNAGQSYPITVEYYENAGGATAELHMIDSSGAERVVPAEMLTQEVPALPDGWKLSADEDGDLTYEFAAINNSSVVLRDATGETHEYKYVNNAYVAPPNEEGILTRNADGSLTLQDSDGKTYVFNSDGTIRSVTNPVDSRKAAVINYDYGTSPGSANPNITHLLKLSDSVDTSRFAQLIYAGESACPAVPSGFDAVPTNMVCALKTSDNRVTQFVYQNDPTGKPQLARIVEPGNEIQSFGYDSAGTGLLTQMRTALANDAVSAGVRTQSDLLNTTISYDLIGRATKVKYPEATPGATRQAHSYQYNSVDPQSGVASAGYSFVKVDGATEPVGFNRKVEYDSTFRTLQDTDLANLMTTTEWDPVKDMILSTTDPVGLKTMHIYDYADRLTDRYGAAPSAWFGADRKPLAAYVSQVPRNQSGYDEGINSLAATYYNYKSSTKTLSGAPKNHQTGIGGSNGDINRTWGSTVPTPVDTGNGNTGWGVRLSGDVKLNEVGVHTFRVHSDDGVRLYVDDKLIINDWEDGGQRSHAMNMNVTINNTVANSYHPIRVEYYNKNTTENDAQLILYKTSPGGSETAALGSLLTPRYGLTTSQKNFDSSTQVGDTQTNTNYGASPELGLAQSSIVDPGGLNYNTSSSYEAQGATGSLMRMIGKTLPGGTNTSYGYFGATETADNPCTPATEVFKQGGMLKLKTEPGLAGAGAARTTETVYDDAGRVVAIRYNTDPWTCTTYDDRGRVTQVQIPAINGASARTVTNSWAVGGNPLITNTSDPEGTIQTTFDLLGRTVTYSDSYVNTTQYVYDAIGRLTSKTSPVGLEEYVYNNFNRLTEQKLDSVVLSYAGYDAFGRLNSATYPTAGSSAVSIGYDQLGRSNNVTYTLGDSTSQVSDSVTRSQSGQIISGTELGQAKSYSYDKASRLVSATVAGQQFTYGFGTATGCAVGDNANAGKNANRTSATRTNGGTTTTTNYCYNNADQLVSSTDPTVTNAEYDAHGNTRFLGSGTTRTEFRYDSSDRNSAIIENNGGVEAFFSRDAQNRIKYRSQDNYGLNQKQTFSGYTGTGDTADFIRNTSWTVVEKYQALPGGVLLTIRPTETDAAKKDTYSLPNIHGDVMATTNTNGTSTGSYQYDPFGQLLSSTAADNTTAGNSYGWVGKHQKQTEKDFTLKPQEMGARIYIASLGRFLQVDPIEGGVENRYIYPADPINKEDLDGQAAFLIPVAIFAGRIAVQYAAKHVAKKAATVAARNLSEKLAMQTVRANPKVGIEIMKGKIKDARYSAKDGWRKMEYRHVPLTNKGKKVIVHYFYNSSKKAVKQVKIKRYR